MAYSIGMRELAKVKRSKEYSEREVEKLMNSNSIKHSPSSEADSCSSIQEIPILYGTQGSLPCLHKRPKLGLITSQVNRTQQPHTAPLTLHCNTILHSTFSSPKRFPIVRIFFSYFLMQSLFYRR
jgi:hypothetical protein